jgi:O-antigen/teichoic acid export membrane protein
VKTLSGLWIQFHEKSAILADSSAFFLSNLGNSLIGMVFWIAAGRLISPDIIGMSSSILSTTFLIGNIGLLGLNHALTIKLPKSDTRTYKNALISRSLLIVFFASAVAGLFYAKIPYFPGKPERFFSNHLFVLAFTIFCALWGIHLLLDQVLITLKSGNLTVQKNLSFSISRIILLLLIIQIIGQMYSVLAATGLGVLISLLIVISISQKNNLFRIEFDQKTDLNFLRILFPQSIKFYLANLFGGLSIFLLPGLVLEMIGADTAAYFYICWMIANLANTGPAAIGVGAFTEGARQGISPDLIKKAIKYILLISIPITVSLLFFAPWILLIYSPEYSSQGTPLLRLLAIAVIPYSIIELNFAIFRVSKRLDALIANAFLMSFTVVVGSVYLIPIFGLEGVGIARIVGFSLIALIGIIINIPVLKSIWKKETSV